jgi:hypothetical protein
MTTHSASGVSKDNTPCIGGRAAAQLVFPVGRIRRFLQHDNSKSNKNYSVVRIKNTVSSQSPRDSRLSEVISEGIEWCQNYMKYQTLLLRPATSLRPSGGRAVFEDQRQCYSQDSLHASPGLQTGGVCQQSCKTVSRGIRAVLAVQRNLGRKQNNKPTPLKTLSSNVALLAGINQNVNPWR